MTSSRRVFNVNSLHRKYSTTVYYGRIMSNEYFLIILYLYLSFSGDSIVRSLKTRLECIRKITDTDSAIESGPNSNLGRRNAYESLACQQRTDFEGV